MALAVRRDARMSVAEYRRWVEPRPDEERWELLDGEPVLMAPPSARHQRIVLNIAQHLDALAKERGCGAYPGLAILSDAMYDYAPYPDVVVHCGSMPRPCSHWARARPVPAGQHLTASGAMSL